MKTYENKTFDIYAHCSCLPRNSQASMVLNVKQTLTLSLSAIPPVVADFLGIPGKSKSMHVNCTVTKKN